MGHVIKKDALPETPLSIAEGNRPLHTALERQYLQSRFLADVKSGVIDVALKIAESIVGDTVTVTPEILEKKYADALAQVTTLQPGTIRIHPNGEASTAVSEMASRIGFRLVTDDTLHPADCVVETADAKVDATVKTALYHLRKCLTKI